MADNDSNTVKPVEILQNIPVLTPAGRREQRKNRRQPHGKKRTPMTSKTLIVSLAKTKMTGPPLAESIIVRDAKTSLTKKKDWSSKWQKQQDTF